MIGLRLTRRLSKIYLKIARSRKEKYNKLAKFWAEEETKVIADLEGLNRIIGEE